MPRCVNICCGCDAKTSCLLAGVLASFSTIYYFAIGFLGLLDFYITHILIDLWSFVLSFFCLFAAVIVLIGYQSNNVRFVMAFVLLYGVCTCFRAVYVVNALVVWNRWSKTDWVEPYEGADDDDGSDPYSNEVVRISAPAYIANFWFLLICLVLDVWTILGAIVWSSQLNSASHKLEAAAAAADAGRRIFAVYDDPHQYSLGGEIYLPGSAAAAAAVPAVAAASGKIASSSGYQQQQQQHVGTVKHGGTEASVVKENSREKPSLQPVAEKTAAVVPTDANKTATRLIRPPQTVSEKKDIPGSDKKKPEAIVRPQETTGISSSGTKNASENNNNPKPAEDVVVIYLPQLKADASDIVLLGNVPR